MDIHRNCDFLRSLYLDKAHPGRTIAWSAKPAQIPIFGWEGGDYSLSTRPVEHWVPWVVDHYRQQIEWQETLGDDSVPFARVVTGTQIFASAMGCDAEQFSDTNPCAIARAYSAAEADKIEEPDLWNCRPLMRVFELLRQVQRELGPEAFLGVCDMQSGFDTASLVWDKTDLYCALADPEERQSVIRLAEKCARLFKKFLIELRKEFPTLNPAHCPDAWAPPEMGPWLSNDECGVVSTPVFEEVMLPELIDLAETFGSLGMHCCASAEHQFESFKKIPNFYAFNRGPRRPGPEGLMPLLDHFPGHGSPVHVPCWYNHTDIIPLKDQAPEGTRFIFAYSFTELDQAKRWLETARGN